MQTKNSLYHRLYLYDLNLRGIIAMSVIKATKKKAAKKVVRKVAKKPAAKKA
ncbi:MAG: hypothetical protein ACI9YB_000792, partial [Halioglobus sp.]